MPPYGNSQRVCVCRAEPVAACRPLQGAAGLCRNSPINQAAGRGIRWWLLCALSDLEFFFFLHIKANEEEGVSEGAAG